MTSSPSARAADQATNRADFVLEAGGVKGAALVGALAAFEDAGYRPNRIAGTSAGAIVGGLFASRISASEVHDILITKKFSDFVDPTFWQRLPLPLLGTVLSELFDAGMYKGRSLEDYLDTILARHGVKTFAELRLDDPGVDPNVPPEQRYTFVAVAADVTRKREEHFPWHFQRDYGLDPDDQSAARVPTCPLQSLTSTLGHGGRRRHQRRRDPARTPGPRHAVGLAGPLLRQTVGDVAVQVVGLMAEQLHAEDDEDGDEHEDQPVLHQSLTSLPLALTPLNHPAAEA